MIKFGKFGKYDVQVKCLNCGKDCLVGIKKGVSVTEAIEDKSIYCDNCGVAIEPTEYKTKWLT